MITISAQPQYGAPPYPYPSQQPYQTATPYPLAYPGTYPGAGHNPAAPYYPPPPQGQYLFHILLFDLPPIILHRCYCFFDIFCCSAFLYDEYCVLICAYFRLQSVRCTTVSASAATLSAAAAAAAVEE